MPDRSASYAVIVTARQVDGPAFQDCLHGENTLDRKEVESRDELLIKGVVAGHPARDGFDKVIAFAADAIEISYLMQTLHVFAEGFGPCHRMMPRSDQNKNCQVQSERRQINGDTRFADDSAGLKALQAPPAGVLGQADTIGQFALGKRAGLLKHGENLEIKIIKFFHFPDRLTTFRANSAENR